MKKRSTFRWRRQLNEHNKVSKEKEKERRETSGTDVLESLKTATDHNELARTAIEEGNGAVVAEHLSQFSNIDYAEIAVLLIKAGEGKSVAEHITDFQVNHSWIVYELVAAGEGARALEHINDFDFEGLDDLVITA